MATRFVRPPTAFSISGGLRKRPRDLQPGHLDFIRQLPCLASGIRGRTEAAHIRYPDLARGKPSTGMGEKPSDRWAVPLASEAHRAQHARNEARYWQEIGIDPVVVALALWGCTGDVEAGEVIIRQTRMLAGL